MRNEMENRLALRLLTISVRVITSIKILRCGEFSKEIPDMQTNPACRLGQWSVKYFLLFCFNNDDAKNLILQQVQS